MIENSMNGRNGDGRKNVTRYQGHSALTIPEVFTNKIDPSAFSDLYTKPVNPVEIERAVDAAHQARSAK